MSLLCVRLGKAVCTTDASALLLKTLYPGKFAVYSDGCYDIPEFGTTPEDFRNQIQGFIDAGADGLKMGDGEFGPGVPLDDPKFDRMFDLLEETGFPILWHVGGAVWMPARRKFQKIKDGIAAHFLNYVPGRDDDVPEGPSRGQTTEQLEAKRAQIENLLARHPKLRLTFAHMYFMSNDLDRLADFLNRHPLINVDLTPCNEIYYFLSQDPKRSRDFICEYSDRIIFGTDNTVELAPMETLINMRRFLEGDEKFYAPQWGFDVQGIELPREVLTKIYSTNFRARGETKPLNPKKAAEYCDFLYDLVRDFEEMGDTAKEDVLECARRFRAM